MAPAVPWLGIRGARGCGLGRFPFPQRAALCCRPFVGTFSSFPLIFLPFLCCSGSLYPTFAAAELGRVSPAGVTLAFGLCVPSFCPEGKAQGRLLPTIPCIHSCCHSLIQGIPAGLSEKFGAALWMLGSKQAAGTLQELLPADIWELGTAPVSAQLRAEEVGSPRHLQLG